MFIPFVAGNAGGVRIQHRFAVHQKAVLMVAMAQLDLSRPPTIHRSLHGKWAPMIEITHEFNRMGAWRRAIKVNWPE